MSAKPKHLIVFGGQGAGKGTQAKRLEKHYGLVYIGIGDVLREMARENSPLGKRLDQTVNQAGHLIPDDLASEIIGLQIGNLPPNSGFVLDGYPRTVAQAGQFKERLNGLGRLVDRPIFIYLDVPRDEAKRRLTKRRQIEQRHDDVELVIKKRLAIYDEHTKPVLDAVKDWATVIEVNGHQPIPQVAQEIIAKLDAAQS